MNNGNSAVYPNTFVIDTLLGSSDVKLERGITKRELLAGLALQGYIATFNGMNFTLDAMHAASTAVKFADALLKELEEGK